MTEEKQKAPKTLEIILAMAVVLGAFGSILGLESNIQPFNDIRIKTHLSEHIWEQAKKQNVGLGSPMPWPSRHILGQD